MAPARPVPVALTIAGSDCCAGAGAQADLKTFSALGVFGLTAITCVVAEVPGKVGRIDSVDPENLRQQLALLTAHYPIGAIKTGLLRSREIIAVVVAALDALDKKNGSQIPLIVDPVMVATSGALLLEADAIADYETRLFPRATLVTPNLDEATVLLGNPIRDFAEMREAGNKLAAKYRTRFLLKGGHLAGDSAVDFLCDGDSAIEFSAPFTRGLSTHGTGCTYSAAIAAGLALGDSLDAAIRRAKIFVSRAIEHHFSWPSAEGGSIDALDQNG
jgi:hydroxymethylpyrimidine/phosphomethylpyrimidine kinase